MNSQGSGPEKQPLKAEQPGFSLRYDHNSHRSSGSHTETYDWTAPSPEDLGVTSNEPVSATDAIDYEWPEKPRNVSEAFAPFQVTFTTEVVGGGRLRLFLFQEIEQAGDDIDRVNRFLVRLAGYGVRGRRVDPNCSDEYWLDNRISLALFRHRFEGHERINTKLNSARDFFEIGPSGQVECILPGLLVDESDFSHNRNPSTREYTRVLYEKLNQCRKQFGLTTLRFSNVRTAFRDHLYLLASQSRPRQTQPVPDISRNFAANLSKWLETRSHRPILDRYLPLRKLGQGADLSSTRTTWWDILDTVSTYDLDHVSLPLSVGKISESVRTCMYAKHCTNEDFQEVFEDRRRRGDNSVFDLLLSKLHEMARGSKQSFDTWFHTARKRKFRTVLPKGRRDGSTERELLEKSYALLQWSAIERTARNYGFTIAMINADFRMGSPAANRFEEQAFEALHLRNPSLADLPIWFLDTPQRSCAVPHFAKTAAATVFARDRYEQSECFKNFFDTTLVLGMYGDIVRTRRRVDRTRKAEGKSRVSFNPCHENGRVQPKTTTRK